MDTGTERDFSGDSGVREKVEEEIAAAAAACRYNPVPIIKT